MVIISGLEVFRASYLLLWGVFRCGDLIYDVLSDAVTF